ncbi:MAG: cobalt-precorrin 5A hydrolase [Ruminococcus sp.]|nr:cobalt-precorrin 5A hydrolase [Ruminococcus sp.]
MKAAIISLTEQGRRLSFKIAANAKFISSERFCFHSHSDIAAGSFDSLSFLVSDIFNEFDALIFICACGIAVRSVAPLLRSKTSDPAVVVIDDCGRFVIPVLSGHIGGANALAEKLAELIGAQAVITTATDVGGHFSPDSFAAANGLIITDMEASKAVASAVLDCERIGFFSAYEYVNMPDELTGSLECQTGICVVNSDFKPFPVTLRLVPKNIVLGIGCKRGTDCDTIEKAVLAALKAADIAIERVCAAATIDIKSNEQGLLGFCKKYGFELHTYTASELAETEGDFSASDFVQSVTGVDNVCERSAVKCSGGKLVLRKTAADGVTVAAAEKPLILDFGKKVL